VFADDGVEALGKAAEFSPDLILLDVMMPGIDGFEVCRRLRADPLLAEVPVIMVTGLGDRDSRLKGIEVGADDFVSKPFDRTELQARVRNITRLNRYRQRLRQSERMASLGRLLAGVAHELNNPINFIYSNIFHLRNYLKDIRKVLSEYRDICSSAAYRIADRVSGVKKLEEELDLDYIMQDLDQLVDDISEGARRTKRIVDDLRAFSRSDEGKTEDTDINEDIEKSLNLLVNYHKDRITIHKDYSDLPKVKAFTGQMGQMFMNLISNACQAIDGKGDIWIATQLEDNAVVISIKDNGMGIAEEHIGKIFDPFFTTKDVGEGVGLGLSISYGIIQRHKGEFLVDSKVGSGTTFTIQIPVDFENQIASPEE
jgi:two-component system NtrC family sensor kinase